MKLQATETKFPYKRYLLSAISLSAISTVPTENCLGIMSDSANVMQGEKGVEIEKFKKESPHVLDVGGCRLHHIQTSACQALGKVSIG